MLKRLRLHNFRTFLNAECAFERRNLLIGRNNSGKTSLSTAIKFLGTTANADLLTAATWVPGGAWEIKNRYLASNTVEVKCDCELKFEGQPYEFQYELLLKSPGESRLAGSAFTGLTLEKETLAVAGPDFPRHVLLDNNGRTGKMLDETKVAAGSQSVTALEAFAPSNATLLSKVYEHESNRRVIAFRNYLASWSYYQLDPFLMRYPPRPDSWVGHSGLDPRGENLFAAIFQLKNLDELRYRKLIEHVQRFDPELEAINFVPFENRPIPTIALRGGKTASWEGLSDGTLRALSIAFIIETRGAPSASPSVTVIEEPENGIAPTHLRALFDLFEQRAPLSQFIFTSHSPYFINMFDGEREAVTILRRRENRTELLSPSPVPSISDDPENVDTERFTLAEEYALELFE